VINSNLPPILHRFRDPWKCPKSLYLTTPLQFDPRLRGSHGTISVKFLPKGHRWPRSQMA